LSCLDVVGAISTSQFCIAIVRPTLFSPQIPPKSAIAAASLPPTPFLTVRGKEFFFFFFFFLIFNYTVLGTGADESASGGALQCSWCGRTDTPQWRRCRDGSYDHFRDHLLPWAFFCSSNHASLFLFRRLPRRNAVLCNSCGLKSARKQRKRSAEQVDPHPRGPSRSATAAAAAAAAAAANFDDEVPESILPAIFHALNSASQQPVICLESIFCLSQPTLSLFQVFASRLFLVRTISCTLFFQYFCKISNQIKGSKKKRSSFVVVVCLWACVNFFCHLFTVFQIVILFNCVL
jgi:hypothetical protein